MIPKDKNGALTKISQNLKDDAESGKVLENVVNVTNDVMKVYEDSFLKYCSEMGVRNKNNSNNPLPDYMKIVYGFSEFTEKGLVLRNITKEEFFGLLSAIDPETKNLIETNDIGKAVSEYKILEPNYYMNIARALVGGELSSYVSDLKNKSSKNFFVVDEAMLGYFMSPGKLEDYATYLSKIKESGKLVGSLIDLKFSSSVDNYNNNQTKISVKVQGNLEKVKLNVKALNEIAYSVNVAELVKEYSEVIGVMDNIYNFDWSDAVSQKKITSPEDFQKQLGEFLRETPRMKSLYQKQQDYTAKSGDKNVNVPRQDS